MRRAPAIRTIRATGIFRCRPTKRGGRFICTSTAALRLVEMACCRDFPLRKASNRGDKNHQWRRLQRQQEEDRPAQPFNGQLGHPFAKKRHKRAL